MLQLTRLFKYVKKYKLLISLNVISNILMVFFSVISIPTLIPFLEILLGQKELITQKPEFTSNTQGIINYVNYYISQIIITKGQETALIYISAGIVTIYFFKNLFRYSSLFFMAPVRNGIIMDIRQQLFDKTLSLPLSYFSEERKGDIISRVTADVQEIEWSILNVLEAIVREPLMIAGSLLVMIYISPSLTVFTFILLIFTGIVIGGIGKALRKQSSQVQTKLGTLISVLEEELAGLRIIKAFNAQKYQSEKFYTHNKNYKNLLTTLLRRRDLSSPLSEFLGILTVVFLIGYGYKEVSSGTLTASTFIAFLFAFFMVIEPAKKLAAAYYNVQKGLAAMDRIDEVLLAKNPITERPDAISLTGITQKIEYKDVSFSYGNNDEKVLKNINLVIPAGKITALVGASGSGKTTLADLLPRFYDVDEGEITIDGHPIKNLKIDNLRSLLGIVSQEAVLFNDTIYNNIKFSLENTTEEAVIQAAKIANAHDFILKTENGYQTNIGDRGNKLSGGQRQRLTIARAVLKNPPILILDEATSALDTESEKMVQEALDKLMKNRTSIVIAHRLSTIQNADMIVVMSDGEILEQGTHRELMARDGAYKKLVNMQEF